MSYCGDTTQLLWEEFFKDPSHNTNQEKSFKSPYFGHKCTGKALWIDRRYTPPLVHKKLQGMILPCRNAEEDHVSLLKLIKSCGKEKDLLKVKRIHANILDKGLITRDIYVATSLLHTYAKCGALREACEIFDQLPRRDVACWNALIAGYVENDLAHEALKCFGQMEDEGVSPNKVTFIFGLKACSAVGSLEIGEVIHSKLREQGLLEGDIVLCTIIMNMYAKCDAIEKAREVFDQLQYRDIVSWNALIVGYTSNGFGAEALKCFRKMVDDGISPDSVTYLCSLKACTIERSLDTGVEIHDRIREQGLLNKDSALGTTLVDMYAKCGALLKAEEVFDQILKRDVVSWNALITGYVENGFGDHALKCFSKMEEEGVNPDAVTYICLFKACAIIKSLEVGEKLHAKVNEQGLLDKDSVLGNMLTNMLIYMYAKCNALQKAQHMFNQLSERTVVSWNALIAAYVEHSQCDQALACLRQMEDEGFFPNELTYTCCVKACLMVGSLEIGEKIHARVKEQGYLLTDIVLGNSLINMYAKCGALDKAHKLFDELPQRDVVSWTALMDGYARVGDAHIALETFQSMRSEGILPDRLTFLILLNALSHEALLAEGEQLFDDMVTVYGLAPDIEHYACMIDLHCRAGQFDRAKIFLFDQVPLFLAFLGACRKWVNVELGKWAFENILQLDEKCVAAYICMANIYAAAGMQKEADEIEAFRVKCKAWKV